MNETKTQQPAAQSLPNPLTTDTSRKPYEQETALHLAGDALRYNITSFKRVVFAKLLERPAFCVKRLHLINSDGNEYTVDSIEEAQTTPNHSVVGVEGWMPVGSLSIGAKRTSDSQANIVKKPLKK